MSNKLNFPSHQSIDTTLKLSIDLRKELLEQFESFNLSKNNYLLIELKKLVEFKNKEKRSQTSYLEVNVNQVEKIVHLLHKLEGHNQLKNPLDNLKAKLDKIKDEIIEELIMLPAKLYPEFETDENIDLNNDQYFANNQLNNDEKVNKLVDCNKIDDHIWKIIFGNLSIDDLLNCRLVNKKFKCFSDHTNGINKLIIGQGLKRFEDYYWHYNNELLDDKDIISLKCFRTIQKLSIFNLDQNLKYLKIYDPQFKLEELPNLINLESIEFGYYFYNLKIISSKVLNNLNNLKVLVSNSCVVQLNAPKLEKIQSIHLSRIKLNSNPDSIKHLITLNYGDELEIFKSLEILELIHITESFINENLLSIFKNLKQLKINSNLDKAVYSSRIFQDSLIKILSDINDLKLEREIDIHIEGIKIENIDKFNELDKTMAENSIEQFAVEDYDLSDILTEYRLNNYNLLDSNLSFIDRIDYFKLACCVKSIKDLPFSFFDKFVHINTVYIDCATDVNGLIWFLNNLKNLKSLKINYLASLNEVFYNNLPDTIRYLYIDTYKDYDFILKLSKLIEFHASYDKDLFDLAFTSFLNLKYLNKFKFNYKNTKITIEKIGKYFYLNEENKKLDYNQLIEECNKIRSK